MSARTRIGLLAEIQDLLDQGDVAAAYAASCTVVRRYPDDPIAQRLYAEAVLRLDAPPAHTTLTPGDHAPMDRTTMDRPPRSAGSQTASFFMVVGGLGISAGARAWWVTDMAPTHPSMVVGHTSLAVLSGGIGILALLTASVVWVRVSRVTRIVGGISGLLASSLAVIRIILMVRNDHTPIYPIVTAPREIYGPFSWAQSGMFWMLIGGLLVWYGSRMEHDPV